MIRVTRVIEYEYATYEQYLKDRARWTLHWADQTGTFRMQSAILREAVTADLSTLLTPAADIVGKTLQVTIGDNGDVLNIKPVRSENDYQWDGQHGDGL
jgi:hypothetical protein